MATSESSGDPSITSQKERLQKVLAAAGYGSRRHCEEYITTGRVTVDGQVVNSLGTRVDPNSQKIAVDGERVKIQVKKYYLINKPPGCLCTNSDPSGRLKVIDLLPPMETRVFSVGRLDENTEGLLLVTNDGELAHRLAHPRFQVERVYRVLVAGQPTQEVLNQLLDGFYFTEGKFRVRQAKKIRTKGQSTLLEIIITEGQNREVRRLFARIGHKVMSLQRIQFGPLRLGELAPAEYRPLRAQELDRLRELAESAPARPRRFVKRPPSSGPARPPRPRAEGAANRRAAGSAERREGYSDDRRGERTSGPPRDGARRPARRPEAEGASPRGQKPQTGFRKMAKKTTRPRRPRP